MGTIEKDEAAILKAVDDEPKGIRSSELFHRVRRSVRSLTTFQKRLRHLEEMGRIRVATDINDARARLITCR